MAVIEKLQKKKEESESSEEPHWNKTDEGDAQFVSEDEPASMKMNKMVNYLWNK